jgi:hypothetical protein
MKKISNFENYFHRFINENKQKKIFRRNEQPISNIALQRLNDLSAKKYERVFVIGNGPSINTQNLLLLKNEFTICSNAFFLKYPEINWRPTIFTIEDHLPANEYASFFKSDIDSLKIIPYDLKDTIGLTSSIIYINFLRTYGPSFLPFWPKFSNDFLRQSYWGGTVSYLSIQIASYFKPKKIYLIGTDLKYKEPPDLDKSGDIYTSRSDDVNHFHPDYFGIGKKWHNPKVNVMQKSFNAAQKYLRKNNINLINSTNGGNLRMIERVTFEDIF